MKEAESKLAVVRDTMTRHGLAAVRLRGTDWFAWATGGGSSAVLLTAESGVAEAVVTASEALVLTDAIEEDRLRSEEVREPWRVWAAPWQEGHRRDAFLRDRIGGRAVASDRPGPGEAPLPSELVAAKRRLLPEEVERYRALGRDAALAMTEALSAARPDWTEQRLAGAGAQALWARGIHPALTLVGGASRVARFRHATATSAPLGERAMLVFCARRFGLYANLTRFVSFRPVTSGESRLFREIAEVEAAAFASTRPGAAVGEVFAAMVERYAALGLGEEPLRHHQGGTTGYLAREIVATAVTRDRIEDATALAWNPSGPGAKLEDTILCTEGGLEVLTVDPAWPTFMVAGRARPDVLVRP